MHFSFLAPVLALASCVAARATSSGPSPRAWPASNLGPLFFGGHGGPHGSRPCLNDTGVSTLVDGYTYLLEQPGGEDFNATAEAILSFQFIVYSDSILTLSGRPLGQPAYPSKESYIASQFQTPPLPQVTTLDTFATCDQIAWRWVASGIGSNASEVRGIITFDVNAGALQIDTVYSEFNTAAFEADLGA